MERVTLKTKALAVVGMAIPVLTLAACSGQSWEERLQDPKVMDAYHQEARATGTKLTDERLDDIARRLCRGYAAGESKEAVRQREVVNTPPPLRYPTSSPLLQRRIPTSAPQPRYPTSLTRAAGGMSVRLGRLACRHG